jgi:hypothetical protein
MLRELFWTLALGVVLIAAVWLLVRWTQRNDFELGAQAERDGLPLNPGWSRRMREGWGHSWRARHGLNDLAEEIRKVKP